jgi:hypothetical protein
MDLDILTKRSPQLLQQDTLTGLYKGVVLDNRDPFQLGRVRVHCYGIHADFPDLQIEAIPWASIVVPHRGSFSPPALWDRVWVTFDSGDRNSPVVVGFWYGVPMGKGTLGYNCTTGSEIRPECWHQHDLTPEVLMVACSGEGNAMWLESKLLNGTHLSSAITIEDTAGKYIQTKSFHLNTVDYASDSAVPEELQGATVSARVPVRDGVTPVTNPVAGSVSMGHQNLSRSLITDSNSFTIDQNLQYD